MRLITLLMISNFLACAIPRPDTELCVVNAPGLTRKCFNLRDDYDDNGKLKPDASPLYLDTVTVQDLNKNVCTDPDGLANLKAYIKELREELEK